MRLVVTADLHFNKTASRHLVRELIDRINDLPHDAVLLAGDTCTLEGDLLEQCLAQFTCRGPKMLIPGNHELWTNGASSIELMDQHLPARLTAAGWHDLQHAPLVVGRTAFVGSVGWYDYSLAPAHLGIPQRFYEAKLSPGAARQLPTGQSLIDPAEQLPDQAWQAVARWNDGRYVKLDGLTDQGFLDLLLTRLRGQLDAVADAPNILAAIHHLPFAQMLPPPATPSWDFAKAFLGSARIGELLLEYAKVRHMVCGHTHLPDQQTIGHINAINIGGGYRHKRFEVLELP